MRCFSLNDSTWEADGEGRRRWKERMKRNRSQGDSPLAEARDPMPPRSPCQSAEKGQSERGTSIRPLHRNEQDVWTQLRTSQTPPEPKSSTATMSRPTCSIGSDKIYGRLCAGLPTYLCTSTDFYLPVRLTAGLVCQWMCMIMFDYVSPCVCINEIEILICMCWYAHVCVCKSLFVCVRVCVSVCVCEWWRRRKVACGKLVLLRAAAVWTCVAAKENCGRKSLLIEHEACHLKLESSETQKPQQAGISVVLY